MCKEICQKLQSFQLSKHKNIFIVINRTSGRNSEQFLSAINEIYNRIFRLPLIVILGADFNVNSMQNHVQPSLIKDLVYRFDFEISVRIPTKTVKSNQHR